MHFDTPSRAGELGQLMMTREQPQVCFLWTPHVEVHVSPLRLHLLLSPSLQSLRRAVPEGSTQFPHILAEPNEKHMILLSKRH